MGDYERYRYSKYNVDSIPYLKGEERDAFKSSLIHILTQLGFVDTPTNKFAEFTRRYLKGVLHGILISNNLEIIVRQYRGKKLLEDEIRFPETGMALEIYLKNKNNYKGPLLKFAWVILTSNSN